MATSIPEGARIVVKDRDSVRCCRCGVPAPTGEWHHRRSRRVADAHQHSPCNGIWLCSTCHKWVHAHPFLARQQGFIVSMHEREPEQIPVKTVWGWRYHDHVGNYEQVIPDPADGSFAADHRQESTEW